MSRSQLEGLVDDIGEIFNITNEAVVEILEGE